MTIATNADLKSTVATYLNRSNLTSLIPVFIQQAETRIAYGSREPNFNTEPLRIRAMETSSYATINAQKIQLPTGYLAQRRFYLTSYGELTFLTPDMFWAKFPDATAGQPSHFTEEGENFVFGPAPDGAYDGRCLYYAKFSPLVDNADTNWLLTNAPAVYLQGTLLEAYRYTRTMDQAMAALGTFSGMINGLNLADKSDRFSNPWIATTDTGNP